jgi:hypothetical protein
MNENNVCKQIIHNKDINPAFIQKTEVHSLHVLYCTSTQYSAAHDKYQANCISSWLLDIFFTSVLFLH